VQLAKAYRADLSDIHILMIVLCECLRSMLPIIRSIAMSVYYIVHLSLPHLHPF